MELYTLLIPIITNISVNMSIGIPNLEIEKIFKSMGNDDLNENFLSVSPSHQINKFISLEKMMPGLKYLLLISKTDRSEKGVTHWWSILNISPSKELFLIDSFSIEGLKNFIIQR